MTELKTLEDFRKWFVKGHTYSAEDIQGKIDRLLKAEAVKWVKFERGKFGKKTIDTQSWIIQFFNLTEEDLEEKQ